ncbi:MAG: hypothetical protein JO138_01615 [Acidobacteriaceae bacterium]|nr:hypothetical protein [Acidobacteriaceae bacterium]
MMTLPLGKPEPEANSLQASASRYSLRSVGHVTALAITPVVGYQNGRSGLQDGERVLDAMGYVSGVAVEEERRHCRFLFVIN